MNFYLRNVKNLKPFLKVEGLITWFGVCVWHKLTKTNRYLQFILKGATLIRILLDRKSRNEYSVFKIVHFRVTVRITVVVKTLTTNECEVYQKFLREQTTAYCEHSWSNHPEGFSPNPTRNPLSSSEWVFAENVIAKTQNGLQGIGNNCCVYLKSFLFLKHVEIAEFTVKKLRFRSLTCLLLSLGSSKNYIPS